jgi:ABC-type branched-subunit amino acid transport system substrate-binding protein
MQRRELAILSAVALLLSGFGAGFWVCTLQNRDRFSQINSRMSLLEGQINELKNPVYTIGIVYPMSGRLDWWARDTQPVIEAAERDLQAMLDETGSPVRFNFLFADSESTGEGALEAVKSLVDEGAQIIVGLPTSGEVDGVLSYIIASGIPVISPASTASHLSRPDSVFRLSTPENYRARIGAELAIELGYGEVIVIHRDDGWGSAYAETVSRAFTERGLKAHSIAFEPSHTYYMNYSDEVRELEALADEGERALVYLVAWENEDYSILYEARKSPVLSRVRWFTAALYPTIIEQRVMFGMAEGLRDFAIEVGLWAPEQRPIVQPLTIRLMEEARTELGRFPSYEHIYLYDAVMIAAKAFLTAGCGKSESLTAAIPLVAEQHFGATGHKSLDQNGDLLTEDTAFIGVVKQGETYELGYYAFHDGSRNEFSIMDKPRERKWWFSPQA